MKEWEVRFIKDTGYIKRILCNLLLLSTLMMLRISRFYNN